MRDGSERDEYEPAFGAGGDPGDDPESARVERAFAAAAEPFLSSPVPWLAWAALLPAAALATPWAAARGGTRGVVLAWSLAVLAGGVVEASAIVRRGGARRRASGAGASRSPLAGWALGVQGNLSIVGGLVSLALLVAGLPELVPALWLLLVGHSFFALGGLADRGLRAAGLLYQLGGLAALLPGAPPLVAFAAATATANLWLAASIHRRRRHASRTDRRRLPPAGAP